MHWIKLESVNIYFKGEEKVIWAPCYVKNNAYESHSTFSSRSSPLDPQRKGKNFKEREKLFTRESSQQEK